LRFHFIFCGSAYWASLNYPHYTQAIAYLQEVFSFIFALTKALILLPQTGLPNKSMQRIRAGYVCREFGRAGPPGSLTSAIMQIFPRLVENEFHQPSMQVGSLLVMPGIKIAGAEFHQAVRQMENFVGDFLDCDRLLAEKEHELAPAKTQERICFIEVVSLDGVAQIFGVRRHPHSLKFIGCDYSNPKFCVVNRDGMHNQTIQRNGLPIGFNG
jgi:hypothetical protein